MRISDWSSDVCSSDLVVLVAHSYYAFRRWSDPDHSSVFYRAGKVRVFRKKSIAWMYRVALCRFGDFKNGTRIQIAFRRRSEEHTSELQSLMRISYAVFCLKKKKHTIQQQHTQQNHTSKHNL